MAFLLLLAKEPKPGASGCVTANGSCQAAAGEVTSDQTRQPEGGKEKKRAFISAYRG